MSNHDQSQDMLVQDLLSGNYSSDELATTKVLDLSGLEIRSLPDDLFGHHFKSLESIVLAGNKLTWISGRFESERANVISLDLSHNYLFTLPRWVSVNLIGLRKLDISDNFFNDDSVECLGLASRWLRSLDDLDARNCRFKTIPVVFCRFPRLRRLLIGNKELSLNRWDRNCLPTIPSYLVNLQSLSELSIANAFVQSLPENLGELRNLRVLDISRNEIAFLPNSLVNLRALEVSRKHRHRINLCPSIETN